MGMKAVVLVVVALAMLLILFEVDWNPQFGWPQSIERPDAEQEVRFRACVDEHDRIIHAETFAAIDNPDVQREVLSTRKEQAARECRESFPQRTVRIEEPFRFNLIDLEFRH